MDDRTARFGDISPAFATACGATVDFAFTLRARKAQGRALAAEAKRPAVGAARPVLPTEIPTQRGLPASRVQTAIVTSGETGGDSCS